MKEHNRNIIRQYSYFSKQKYIDCVQFFDKTRVTAGERGITGKAEGNWGETIKDADRRAESFEGNLRSHPET